jgi:hypothetical protein
MKTDGDELDIRRIIDGLDFFRGMDSEWLDTIAGIGQIMDMDRGHFVSR